MQIVGDKFGKLRVLYMWLPDRYVCRCECGEHEELFRSQLVAKTKRQCRNCTRGDRTTHQALHGHLRTYVARNGRRISRFTREYSTWSNMKSRCSFPKHHAYENYGGRGIRVCEQWLLKCGRGFANFIADMGPRPQGMTLDRIEVQGHYEPGNCKWATWDEQGQNRRPQLYPDGNEPEVKPLDDFPVGTAFGPDNAFETVETTW